VELKCELSPLVFAVLYRTLADDKNQARQDLLAERLAEVGWEADWLAEAAECYEKTWQGQLKRATTVDDLAGLSDENALLASWIMAVLRTTGASYDFGEKLRANVTTRALKEIPAAPTELPPQWCPEIVGWTLSMVIGTVDRRLPVAPAVLPADPNVKAAYEGLVEHVLHLGETPPPWPEILGTSTYWRGTGLAEGLKPEARDGKDAIRQLIIECRQAVPDHLRRRLSQHFEHFAEIRNTLSHVADMPGRPRFVEVKEGAREWSQIYLTILGITQFLGLQVSAELLESASRAVRPGTWDDLQWELSVYAESE
jgi:hypothetical protein